MEIPMVRLDFVVVIAFVAFLVGMWWMGRHLTSKFREIIPTAPLRESWREPLVQELHVDVGDWIRIKGDGFPEVYVTFTREAMLRMVTVA